MKAPHRFRNGRLWLAATSILIGMAAGYFVGRESILHNTGSRLSDYAERVLERDVEVASEVTKTLDKADASPYEPCSEEDIALLRRLTFVARFLKDVGRIQGTNFVCSATAGKMEASAPVAEPDIFVPPDVKIYRHYPLLVPKGDLSTVITSPGSDVVLSPDNFGDFPEQPLHFDVGVADREKDLVYAADKDPTRFPDGVLKSQKVVRRKGVLYRSRCSDRFPLCAVTSIQVQTLWRASRTLLYGYVTTGTFAGLICAAGIMAAGRKRRSPANQLKRAILMGKLSVAYQPIVELSSHRIVGAEALARWTDEAGESIRPETIIALADAEGFVSEITRFVLTRSLEELGSLLENKPNFRLSINLAPADLADPRLLMLLDEKLGNSTIAAESIAFELPERATSDRDVAISSIRRLRERGHAIFIDDFGSGYSNLAYLTELNVDGIKVNRSFIATIGTESVTASIVPQILAVAEALKLKVVVQGIERKEQAVYFASNDPDMLGQGWFFGLPVPAKSLIYLCAEKSE